MTFILKQYRTAGQMPLAVIAHFRIFCRAARRFMGTPRMKGAPRRLIRRVWYRAGDVVKSFAPFRKAGKRCKESLSIRMPGITKDLFRIPLFRNHAGIHDINPIGNGGHDAEIMSNI